MYIWDQPADENKSAELTKKINQLVVRCGDLRRQLDRFEERGLDEIEHKCSQVSSKSPFSPLFLFSNYLFTRAPLLFILGIYSS